MPKESAHGKQLSEREGRSLSTAVPFKEALRFWIKLGFINFGGPAGQIAIMQHELVDAKKWIPQRQFIRALNFCMILPGPEAQQLAIYIGWLLHGTLGGVLAGAFFVIPSILVLLGLSWMAAASSDVPAIGGLLYGVQPVVIAIVASAVLRIGKKTLCHRWLFVYAALAFIAIHFLHLPFPYVIGAAALSGLILQRWRPDVYLSCELLHRASENGTETLSSPEPRPSLRRNLFLVAAFLALWSIPIALLWALPGLPDVLTRQALFFTKAAFVTFGGAYAVLSYIADMAVNHFAWLDAHQMVQGLGLAESTPGPLIMVTQFVGFFGAWNHHGALSPLLAGTLGALVTTYMTFLPCFFFILLGAPYIERLSENQRLQAALVGVTSAVVGVILNLAVFFGEKVLIPEHGAFDFFAAGLATVSFALSMKFRLPLHYLVPVGALAGMARNLLF